jgi:hypothetical protein
MWIYRRGAEHLLLHCRETRRGVTLVVSGDGDLRSYSFHDYAALVKFESEMEEFLLETGWLTVPPSGDPAVTSDHLATASPDDDSPLPLDTRRSS